MSIAALVKDHSLSEGDEGEAVTALQLALASPPLDYKLKGTGYFGPATDTAVRDFQRIHGLKRDGAVGRITGTLIDSVITDGIIATPEAMVNTARPPWQLVGLDLLNVKEGPGSKDNLEILDWAKEEGGDIAVDFKHDATAWCSLFKNHQFTRAGLPGTETLWALDWAGNWPSIRLAGPATGAVAPMKRFSGGKLIGGHVIDVFGRDKNGNVMGLGGNQGDEVSIRPFPKARLDQGFWWPKGYPLPEIVGYDNLPLVGSDGRLSTNEA